MNFSNSDKLVIFFISQLKKFQIAVPKYLAEFFSKYAVLTFGTQQSIFECNCTFKQFQTQDQVQLKSFPTLIVDYYSYVLQAFI